MLTWITRTWRPGLLGTALLSTGCLQAALDRWDAVTAADLSTGSTSWSSTGEPAAPTTSVSSGIQTVTGPPEETTGSVVETTSSSCTTSPPEENEAPTAML